MYIILLQIDALNKVPSMQKMLSSDYLPFGIYEYFATSLGENLQIPVLDLRFAEDRDQEEPHGVNFTAIWSEYRGIVWGM